jgi:hypothetical protein
MIAVLSERTARTFANSAPLEVLTVPFPSPQLVTAMMWHRRVDSRSRSSMAARSDCAGRKNCEAVLNRPVAVAKEQTSTCDREIEDRRCSLLFQISSIL